MIAHKCLDCPKPTIATVCDADAAIRQQRDGRDWFARLRADLWAKYPDGDWDGCGKTLRREHAVIIKAARRRMKKLEGEPAW